ncbi:MAG: transporter [Thermodesulfovibrionales bacterium]
MEKGETGTLKKPVSFFLLLSLLALFFCLLPPSPAGAFEVKGLQPLSPYGVFSAFSAESLPRKKIGFGVGFEKSSEPKIKRFIFQSAYGLTDKAELNVTLPYVMEWEDTQNGFEDANLGIKYRFLDEGSYTPAVAVLLTGSLPSGKNEFSTDGGLGGGLIVTKKVGPFKGHINALYSNPGEGSLRDEYTLNLGAELAVTHSSKVLAEVVGRKNYFKNKIDLLEWRLGYRIATTDYLYTTIGGGFDIKNRNPDYRFILSLSVILPREKRKFQKIYEE